MRMNEDTEEQMMKYIGHTDARALPHSKVGIRPLGFIVYLFGDGAWFLVQNGKQ